MKILIISTADINYDGRLRELVDVFRKIGNITLISRSNGCDFCSDIILYNCNSENYVTFIKYVLSVTKKTGHFDIVLADNRRGLFPSCLSRKYTTPTLFMNDSRELRVFSDVKNFVGKVGCIIEMMLHKKFDLIIAANEERAKLMQQMYSLERLPLVFMNLRELSDFSMDNSLEEQWGDVFAKYKYNIISVGGCSLERLTDKYVCAVGKRKDCSLFLIGDTESSDYTQMKKLVDQKRFENIYIIPKLKAEQLNYFMNKAQLGLVSYHKNDFNNLYCASGKIYEYVMAGLPMLSSTNIPLVNFCNEYGVGVAFDDIDQGLEELIRNYDIYLDNVAKAQKMISIEENRVKLANEIKAFYENM